MTWILIALIAGVAIGSAATYILARKGRLNVEK